MEFLFMQQQNTSLKEIILVGLTTRTNNKDEMNPDEAKIGALFGSYLGNNIADSIKHRVTPNVTYSVYTEYESDENGDYTYFIGEAVDSLDDQDLSKFKSIVIPASKYQKFTTEAGKIPDIVIGAWQKIWTMGENDFSGKRKYIADFEIYDEKATTPDNAIIDIYIGIE